MSQLEILRLLQRYGEETDLADFSVDELQELLEEMERGGEPLPETFASFKERYFAYYDDVKDKSLKKQDW
jgi:exonuclease VII small subunit